MKTVYYLKDLVPFGIIPLTGEACGLGMRVLCDFDARGRRIISRWLGWPDFQNDIQLKDDWFEGASEWNTHTNGHAHVGSIMLAHDACQSLAIFAFLSSGHKEAFTVEPMDRKKRSMPTAGEGAVYAFSENEEKEKKDWLYLMEKSGWWVRRWSFSGTAGDRNTHEFTRRVE